MTNPRPPIALLPLLLALCFQGYAQTGTINMQIMSPQAPPYPIQVVGDNLNIQVMIESTYQINSVTASLPGGKSVLLSWGGGSTGYTGTISLLGLPQDTTTLTITAVDAYNNPATVTGRFIYDHPPTLTVDSPAAYTVAMPNLHLRTRCHSDSGACTISVVLQPTEATSVTLGTYTDSVDANYDLSAYQAGDYQNSNSIEFEVSATDRRGIGISAPWVPVFVETSPYLTPVFTANTMIYDLSGNKALVNGNVGSPLNIVDITNGSVVNIPYTGVVVNGTWHLTSTGAVFLGNNGGDSYEYPPYLFEWHNGSLDSLGRLNGGLTTAGDYGLYLPLTGGYVLRNLATETNQSVPAFNSALGFNLTPSGGMAYGTNGSKSGEVLWNLFNFSTGSSTLLVDDNSGVAVSSPLTDGRHIVYARQAQSGNYSVIFGSTGNYFDTLANWGTNYMGNPIVPAPPTSYVLNNGYSAYLASNGQNIPQVWLRDTTGKKTQLTFNGNGDVMLEYLNPKGELIYDNQVFGPTQGALPAVRTLYTPTGGSLPFDGLKGQVYYTDSTWYVVIGRTVFRLNAAISPNKSDNFTVNVKPDSLYGFSAGTFDAHFEGSGIPLSVVFTRLPAHGALAVNGAAVTVNTPVPRASLQNLVYTPATGFMGIDTVNWFGSTGYTTSIDTGLLMLNVNTVVAPPVQPVITGLSSVYCSNGGPAVFTMTNFPDTTGGVTVVADTLDNGPLAIGAGASCSIALSGLSAGVHTVNVTYTNAGGSSSLLQAFTIVAASTPAVGVSASSTTIPNTAASVVVSANAVSGGGSAPVYTFALNRGFVPVLSGPGAADSVVIDTAALSFGTNTVYVRMQTSDSCYTAQSATDSIVIMRVAPPPPGGGDTTGTGTGNDSVSATTGVAPNPFRDQLVVTGLQATESYTISLLNSNGMVVLRSQVSGVSHTTLTPGTVMTGLYMVQVYDETKGRVVRLTRVLALGDH